MNESTLRAALRWFPLIAFARFPCRPLPERVAEIAAVLTEPADPVPAAAEVLNRAALLASDLGAKDLARDLCWQHIDAYRHKSRPLTVVDAERMLGPALNLARLHLRADRPDDALRLLNDIHNAVTTGTNVAIDGRELPLADITGTRDDHHRLRKAVWRQVLTDGIRSHAMTGDWSQAAKFAEEHRGVGSHLMEGRQATIIARLLDGGARDAQRRLTETTAAQPWEEQVAACLSALCAPASGKATALRAATERFLADKTAPEFVVFRTRLGLATAQLTNGFLSGAATRITRQITTDAIKAADGYAARDIVENQVAPMTIDNRDKLSSLVTAAGLGRGGLPRELADPFDQAVSTALTALTR